ncbi:hypothetical protein FACS1894152_2990 [Bacilli bacterium]|nr:hypothetical protein FACS1894152_2990 [Bacilli bacterium]
MSKNERSTLFGFMRKSFRKLTDRLKSVISGRGEKSDNKPKVPPKPPAPPITPVPNPRQKRRQMPPPKALPTPFIDSLKDKHEPLVVYGEPRTEKKIIDKKNKIEIKIEDEFMDGKSTGNVRVTHPNGDVYVGQWKDGIINGKGIMRYANGDIYEGDWFNDKMNGRGTFTTRKNGEVYVGDFKDGLKSGKGVLTYANGDICEGQWENDMMNGQGVFKLCTGKDYVNREEDPTKMKFVYRELYRGEFKNGAKNGHGTMTDDDGNTYVGNWLDGRPDGYGTIKFVDKALHDGGTYNGNIGIPADVNEMYYKNNRYRYSNGDSYIGKFEYLMNGTGEYIYRNGSRYDGNFRCGMRDGNGIMQNKNDGSTYKGQWENDKTHGHGIVSWPDGEQFIGDFDSGKISSGDSIYIYSNGNEYSGDIYEGGKISRGGKMTITYRNGNKFEGKWSEDKESAEGTMTYSNGKKAEMTLYPIPGKRMGEEDEPLTTKPVLKPQPQVIQTASSPSPSLSSSPSLPLSPPQPPLSSPLLSLPPQPMTSTTVETKSEVKVEKIPTITNSKKTIKTKRGTKKAKKEEIKTSDKIAGAISDFGDFFKSKLFGRDKK